MSKKYRYPIGIFFDMRTILHQSNYAHIESPKRLLYIQNKILNEQSILSKHIILINGNTSLLSLEDLKRWLKSDGYNIIRNDIITVIEQDIINNNNRIVNFNDKKQLYEPKFLYTLEKIFYNNNLNNFIYFNPKLNENFTWYNIQNILEQIHDKYFILQTLQLLLNDDFPDSEIDSETENDNTIYPGIKNLPNSSDTFINKYSYISIYYSLQGLLFTLEAIVQDFIKTAFVLIRPPGHHASISNSDGCCIFNTVAFITQAALQHISKIFKRVCIVDLDVHHGNGTQDIFYSRSDVLYISIHRYDVDSNFYPQTGSIDEIGRGDGLYYNINLPIDNVDFGIDSWYHSLISQIIKPILLSFNPQLICISLGFDAMNNDPIGGFNLTPNGISHCIRKFITIYIYNIYTTY